MKAVDRIGPLARRVFRNVVDLRTDEATPTLLLFSYSFLVMTAYNILKPITRSKFITALGADNLPYVQLAAGFLIALLMHFYGRALRVLPRAQVIPVTLGGIAALLVVFWFLFRTDADWVAVPFYIVGLILGILLISQFWTLANDVYDARQARRLFGVIGGGASLGGALGAALTAIAVETVGTDNLLLVSASTLVLCAMLGRTILRGYGGAGAADLDDQRGLGGRESIRLFFESRHVQIIALVIACAAIGSTIVEQQLNMAAESLSGADATDTITLFLAKVTFYLSIIGFVVQVALTSRIHRGLGLAFALLMLPVGLGATAVMILLTSAAWAPAIARVLDATLRYTIDKTSREVLFLPLPASLKYRAKPFIDVTMDRFAKALGALLVLVLIKPWGLALDWRRLSYASLGVTAVWVALALIARREYLRTFRESIGTHAIAPEAVRVDAADAVTIETLVEELANPDEAGVLYAIEMLEALNKRNLVTPLLLHHESPRVRVRALRALGATRVATASRWTTVVNRMLVDDDVDVRAAAMRALTAIRREDATALMRRYLDDLEPRVAVTAAVGLADSGSEDDESAAHATMSRLIHDPREAASPGRLEAARALAHIRNPRFRLLLVPLLDDSDSTVAHEAIQSARDMGLSDGLFVPGLLSLLGHRGLKTAAREALVSGGEGVLDILETVLHDRREAVWVRRHIPATLALIPTQHSMDILIAAIHDPDGFVRYKVLEALEVLRRRHPDLSFSPAAIEALLLKESSRYYNYLTLRHNLLQYHGGTRPLLVQALDNKLDRIVDRIFRLLGLIYPYRDVVAARHSIERGEGRRRAAAVEYLDNMLRGPIRKRVVPILEQMSAAEKVRHANMILGTRPREVNDTVAQLIHDDDPIVASAAIHFVRHERLNALADDLGFVLTRRARDERHVLEAAAWALAALAPDDPGPIDDTIPIVELVARFRGVPLFDFVSVDELFRMAEAGQPMRYSAGHTLCVEGTRAEGVWLVLNGSVRLTAPGASAFQLNAPAVLCLEDVLQGRALSYTVVVDAPSVCFRIGSADFLAMVSDNILLAQGLFRMLLPVSGSEYPTVYSPPPDAFETIPPTLPLQPIDKVLLLRQHPLLAKATAKQLFEVVGITREVELVAGAVLFSADEPTAIYHVLQGEVLLESDGAGVPIRAFPGATLAVAETLAGVASGRRAVVVRDGLALRLDRDELFGVLTDRVDLLQGLFSGVLALTGAGMLRDRAAHDPSTV